MSIFPVKGWDTIHLNSQAVYIFMQPTVQACSQVNNVNICRWVQGRLCLLTRTRFLVYYTTRYTIIRLNRANFKWKCLYATNYRNIYRSQATISIFALLPLSTHFDTSLIYKRKYLLIYILCYFTMSEYALYTPCSNGFSNSLVLHE